MARKRRKRRKKRRKKRRSKRRKRSSRRWIQKAIKKPGALTKWVLKHRAKIKRLTGVDPITKSGEISQLALLRLRKTRWYKRLSARTKRRINLAITLERIGGRKKRRRRRKR